MRSVYSIYICSIGTFRVDALHRPPQVAGPAAPPLIPQHCGSTGDLLAGVQIPEEELICATGGLKEAAIPGYIHMRDVGRVLFHWSVLQLDLPILIVVHIYCIIM